MNILGISAFYHDSAACVVQDGKIIAAAQEERFTRVKHDDDFPNHACQYCLDAAGLSSDQLDYVVFYDKPLLKFERILETYLACAPRGLKTFLRSLPVWMKQKLWTADLIRRELDYKGEVLCTEHHQSHAASAFYPSPFDSAAVLTLDGVGEWTTTSYGVGNGNNLDLTNEIQFPHSLGLLYSAFTYYTGFKVNSGEYKVMGLAPYGEPKYVNQILDNLIDLKADGSFHLDLKYFDYLCGDRMTNSHFDKLFGGPPRKPESTVTQKEMDLARSIQEVTEECMLRIARHLHKQTGERNLCLAGGVALNCVGNGKILRESPFEKLWIQPASGDAGGALGAALACWYGYLRKPRSPKAKRDYQRASLLGPSFSTQEAKAELDSLNAAYKEYTDSNLYDQVAKLLADGNIIGWFQGSMEFGPRALGNRSIIGDPRSPEMQSKMNLKIKFRESFRPFAPAVKREKVAEYFEHDSDSPYMLLVAPVNEARRKSLTAKQDALFGIEKLNIARSDLPAITHVDYSARIQTVDQDEHTTFYKLLQAFEKLTGCPVLVNTSFNVRGEPIVCTPSDAYTCFMRTEMDYLVVENLIFEKSAQPHWRESVDWRDEFQLD